jgi:hypothetical protein
MKRVEELAEGSCAAAYHWRPTNGGRISDTEIILYLVGAFLRVPFWRFWVRAIYRKLSYSWHSLVQMKLRFLSDAA